MKPRLESAPLTQEDSRIFSWHAVDPAAWSRARKAFRSSQAADRRDADIMYIAGQRSLQEWSINMTAQAMVSAHDPDGPLIYFRGRPLGFDRSYFV